MQLCLKGSYKVFIFTLQILQDLLMFSPSYLEPPSILFIYFCCSGSQCKRSLPWQTMTLLFVWHRRNTNRDNRHFHVSLRDMMQWHFILLKGNQIEMISRDKCLFVKQLYISMEKHYVLQLGCNEPFLKPNILLSLPFHACFFRGLLHVTQQMVSAGSRDPNFKRNWLLFLAMAPVMKEENLFVICSKFYLSGLSSLSWYVHTWGIYFLFHNLKFICWWNNEIIHCCSTCQHVQKGHTWCQIGLLRELVLGPTWPGQKNMYQLEMGIAIMGNG